MIHCVMKPDGDSQGRLACLLKRSVIACAFVVLAQHVGAVQQPAAQAEDVRALLTQEELARLGRESNPAKQVKLLMTFAAKRLDVARQQAETEKYDEASESVRQYQAFVAHTYSRIEAIPGKPKNKRNPLKEFDLQARQHLRALDAVLRAFPVGRSSEIEEALRAVTRLRHEALNAFAGDKILNPTKPKPQGQ
jgi:hypothetical protein